MSSRALRNCIVAIVGCIICIVSTDGFALSLPRATYLRTYGMRSLTMSREPDPAPTRDSRGSLHHRRAVITSSVLGLCTSQANAHCLTKACLEGLPDPVAEAPATSGAVASAARPTKLPAAAYVKLSNGQAVCRIQLGCLQLSPKTSKSGAGAEEYWEATQDEAVKAMKQAVDMGFTTFDVADVYGEAEDYVGAFHAAYGFPPNVVFSTKWIPTGTSPKNMTVVEAAIDKARTRMRTPTLDVLQLYWWDYEKPNYVQMATNAQLIAARSDAPALRGLGVTAFDQIHLQELVESGVGIVSAQMSLSVVDTRPLDGPGDGGMLGFCEARGIAGVCHGGLLGGFLSDGWLGVAEPVGADLETSQLRKYYKWLQAWGNWALFQRLLRTLRSIAEKHSRGMAGTRISIANVALRWVLQQRGVSSVVCYVCARAPARIRACVCARARACACVGVCACACVRARVLCTCSGSADSERGSCVLRVSVLYKLILSRFTPAYYVQVVGARLGKPSCRMHLAENARVFDFALDSEDLQAISEV